MGDYAVRGFDEVHDDKKLMVKAEKNIGRKL